MSPQLTAALIAALVTLQQCLNVWLASRSVRHESQLNGVMAGRITAGAVAAINADKAAAAPTAATPVDPVKAARIASLRAALDALEHPSTTP